TAKPLLNTEQSAVRPTWYDASESVAEYGWRPCTGRLSHGRPAAPRIATRMSLIVMPAFCIAVTSAGVEKVAVGTIAPGIFAASPSVCVAQLRFTFVQSTTEGPMEGDSGIAASFDTPIAVEPTGVEPTGVEPTGVEPTGVEPTGAEPIWPPTSICRTVVLA